MSSENKRSSEKDSNPSESLDHKEGALKGVITHTNDPVKAAKLNQFHHLKNSFKVGGKKGSIKVHTEVLDAKSKF